MSPLAPGFLYGLGAFETMRWRVGLGVFRLEAHLDRLSRTLATLGIRWDERESAPRAIGETIEANPVTQDVVARLTVAMDANGNGLTLVTLRDVGYSEAMYTEGVAATIHPTPRATELARHKTLNAAECWIARREANRRGCAEALFCDPEGFLLEGATTNLFLVLEETILTPSENRPLLPGITRKVLLDQTQHWSVPIVQQDVSRNELSRAREVFLTNAVAGLLPVTRIDGHLVGDGTVGSWTKRLRKAYQELCEQERNPSSTRS